MSDPIRKVRILILEHCQECAAYLSRLIEALGHEVRTARDGEEAIEVGAGFRPDVTLLHVRPPGRLDGYEVARRIRDQPWGPGVILIALTRAGGVIEDRPSREAGFDHYLLRPIEVEALAGLIGRPRPDAG